MIGRGRFAPWMYAHYTHLGARLQPRCAGATGHIAYRHGVVERLKCGEDVLAATDGERWIADRELGIERWLGD